MNKIININEKNIVDDQNKFDKLNRYWMENKIIDIPLTGYQIIGQFDLNKCIFFLPSKDKTKQLGDIFVAFRIFKNVYGDNYVISFSNYKNINDYNKFVKIILAINLNLDKLTYIPESEIMYDELFFRTPYFIIDDKFYKY